MKKLDIGQALSVLANVGVLLGILLLVYELSQNRQMMEAQTRNDINTGLMDYLNSADREFYELLIRLIDGEELSRVDISLVRSKFSAQFRHYENMHYQYRVGLFDEVEFEAQRGAWRTTFAISPRVEHWCRVRGNYAPDFVAEIDGLLSTHRCE